ncbi:L,D-transpeptidase family protein [Streptomyces albidus (ex Kaewkla and Franco 2022)]|uniref:L,D-transpeptidase family protein n=1 Tax=Streptomyces albidus (ex Kaewkla and Franco 2022) TaxID=722709 RepID=UPI0015EF2FDA|nr:L,D-transpeptidase family protein [Streptomyces albidus (ex Kaewkla and Franco 2022)]
MRKNRARRVRRNGRAVKVRTGGLSVRAVRTAAAGAAAVVLVAGLGACGGSPAAGKDTGKAKGGSAEVDPTRIPDVGDPLQKKIPREARQVVAVYGKDKDSADATVRLYSKHGKKWQQDRSWPAHNGRKGWTRDHREGDKRSPVGVFTLTDAGGVKPAPDAKLPYTDSDAFTPPSYWSKKTRHDFDHVIAVDYNRAKGTSPLDPSRPQGQSKGGSIWLHMDHGSGTSGCVSLSRSGMRYLLRTLDPDKHPAVVMGDKAALAAR